MHHSWKFIASGMFFYFIRSAGTIKSIDLSILNEPEEETVMPEKEEELQPLADSISITSSVLSSLVVRASGFIQNPVFSNCW